jgi:serine/threonine protein kinase
MARYEITSQPVGQGGFGKVREGHDTVLDRKVAVKSLNAAWTAAPAAEKERFRREARTLAKMSHPNIPAIYDVVQTDDEFTIVFQFVEGTTLRKIIENDGPISLSECRLWFDQIASALQHSHENGSFHRDVKPENFVVSSDRKHCYLVDFGIALSKDEMDRLTDTDDWIGTPGYMSPEQQNGENVDASDDLYVLGGCLYESLCGHPIEHGDYRHLNTISEIIPPAIDNLVRRCIARKPHRLANAADFRAQLRFALQKHRALSEILAVGQLHELVSAIAEMTPQQFMELKAGQRLLILQKCTDVVNDHDRRLGAARIEFLQVMTPLGISLPPDEYKPIIAPAIDYGFGPQSDPHPRGNRGIQDSLITAAAKVTQPNHRVIVEALLEWLPNVDLPSQKNWFYHNVRILVYTLMANTECSDDDAPKLGSLLCKVNELQRSRTQEDPQEREEDEEPALQTSMLSER